MDLPHSVDVSESLFRLGSTGLVEEPDRLTAYFPKQQFQNELELARVLKDEIGLNILLEINRIPARDWGTEWKKYFKPKKISRRFVVRPSWEKYRTKKNEIALIIDPKMSFGTGTHETTQLVLKILEDHSLSKMKVLDIGTGTGILAVAAAKLGSKNIFAFDSDEQAYHNALENIRRNRCSDKIKVAVRTFPAFPKSWPKKYDWILANIQGSVIADMLEAMAARLEENGSMIISGIQSDEDDAMWHEFRRRHLLVEDRQSAKAWTAYRVIKKNYQRVAAIDIGTNTVLLLIADAFADGRLNTVFEAQRMIRLGKNVDAEKNISMEGFEKCAVVLSEYKKTAEEFACDTLVTCGTSALRDARNREWIHYEMIERIGVNIEILSGEEEALRTYHGGRLVLKGRKDRPTLIIDIGGGSTEFILGDAKRIRKKLSLDIGSVRLTERFLKRDPVDASEEAGLRKYVNGLFHEQLGDFILPAGTQCLGVAGTVTTFASILQELTRYRPDKINGFVITRKRLESVLNMLRARPVEKRKKVKGLEPERADIIFAGGLILLEAMDFFHLKKITVSNYGLRYGLVLRTRQRTLK